MRYGQMAGSLEPAAIVRRPSIVHAFFELRFPLEAALFWIHGVHHPWPEVDANNRKVVMLIPGFMAGDLSMTPLASFCRWLGHRTFFTGIRSNSRCPRETLTHLERSLEKIHENCERRIVIIGQSLGGVYARELASRRPDLVERVITLGSPIRAVENSSSPLALAMARLIALLRGMDAGCLTQSCSCGMALVEKHPGEVPTTVVYSRTDGVVHWQSCLDRSGARVVENVEVMASHVGMGVNIDVFRVLADRLAIPARSASRPTPVLRLLRRQKQRQLPQLS